MVYDTTVTPIRCLSSSIILWKPLTWFVSKIGNLIGGSTPTTGQQHNIRRPRTGLGGQNFGVPQQPTTEIEDGKLQQLIGMGISEPVT
eukprot:UN01718